MTQISFTSGQGVGSLVNISIPIIDDDIIEGTEFFFGILTIVTVDERTSPYPKETELHIIDDDGECSFVVNILTLIMHHMLFFLHKNVC